MNRPGDSVMYRAASVALVASLLGFVAPTVSLASESTPRPGLSSRSAAYLAAAASAVDAPSCAVPTDELLLAGEAEQDGERADGCCSSVEVGSVGAPGRSLALAPPLTAEGGAAFRVLAFAARAPPTS